MHYRSLAVVLALTVPALVCAGPATSLTSDQESDVKVQCIVDFVGSELDDSQHDTFINDCVQKKTAELLGTATKSN